MKTRTTAFLIAGIILISTAGFVSGGKILAKPEPERPEIIVSRENLRETVKYLTDLSPARQYRNLRSLNQCARYIENKFKEYGYNPVIQEFNAGKPKYRNVICSLGPENAERVIVGAHYDVCGEQPGADDNASGVAGLLEIARALKTIKTPLKNRIDIVAYTLEEPIFYKTEWMGSAVHAKSLHDAGIKVKAMICLEMIGYYTDEPGSQSFPSAILRLFYPSRGNFIAVIGKIGQGKLIKRVKKSMADGSGVPVHSLKAPTFLPGIDFSDHLNYWKYGYDAVMVTDTAFFRNFNYHNMNDTMDTLDFDKMAETTKGVCRAVMDIAK